MRSFVLVLLAKLCEPFVIHINGKIFNVGIKSTEVTSDKLAKRVVERRIGTVAAFEDVQGLTGEVDVGLGGLLNRLHVLLFLLYLLHELLVLEGAMVERLLEVFPVNIQERLLLIQLLVLELLEFAAETCS